MKSLDLPLFSKYKGSNEVRKATAVDYSPERARKYNDNLKHGEQVNNKYIKGIWH